MKTKHAARDVAVVGVASALMIGCQVGLSFLPNIELVSLLTILYAQFFGRRTIPIIYVFALVEGIIYGFGSWWIIYLYIWTILYFIARRCRRLRSALGWAVISGLYGLFFGLLCSIPYCFILGFYGGVAYFVQGILSDLVHCAGNFVVALTLYRPLSAVMEHAARRLGYEAEEREREARKAKKSE